MGLAARKSVACLPIVGVVFQEYILCKASEKRPRNPFHSSPLGSLTAAERAVRDFRERHVLWEGRTMVMYAFDLKQRSIETAEG